MRQLLLITTLTIPSFFAKAENVKDSLLRIAQTGEIQDRITAYIDLTDFFGYNRSDSALWASKQAVKLASEYGDLELLAQSYKVLGIYYGDVGLYEQAISATYQSIDLFDSINSETLQEDISGSYHNLAWYFVYMEDFERPLDLFHKAMKIIKVADEADSINFAVSLHALGSYHYLYTDNKDSGIYYLEQAIAWRKNLPVTTEEMGQTYVELAQAYLENGDFKNCQSKLEIIKNMDQDVISDYVKNYVLFVEGVKASYVGNHKMALELCQQVYQWGDSTELLRSSVGINLMRYLVDVCENAGAYHLAFNYLEELREIEQQTIYKDRQRTTKALEFEFETARKEQQIDTQKKQLSQSKIILWIIGIGLLIVSILLIWVYKVYQQIKVKNQKIENLMRELHHRVKNNLQVISSLLGLQSMKMNNAEAQKMVAEGKERIRAMALIHQKLYQQEEVSSVNIKEYIENLVNELSQSYGFNEKAEIRLDLINISMDADTSLPLGLIVNEVVSNAFKYAFADIEKPILELKLLQDSTGKYNLSIKDNGIGLPQSFNLEEAQSFGLRLVNILSRQIKGQLEIKNNNGLEYQLTF